MQKNLYAYTATSHPYPEFVSINEDGGNVTITVRGAAQPGPHSGNDCGPYASVALPADQLDAMATALRIAANNIKIMGPQPHRRDITDGAGRRDITQKPV